MATTKLFSGVSASAGVDTAQLNPVFATRMQNLISAAEAATGSQVQITSGYRSPEHQAQIYANFTQKPVSYGGVTYKPNGTSGVAAKPGSSEHQAGTAMDIAPSGKAYQWMVQHAPDYGIQSLATLNGKPYDLPHFQLTRSDMALAQAGKLPLPPGANIPEVASAYADTTIPPVPLADPRTNAAAAIGSAFPTIQTADQAGAFYGSLLPAAQQQPADGMPGSPPSLANWFENYKGVPSGGSGSSSVIPTPMDVSLGLNPVTGPASLSLGSNNPNYPTMGAIPMPDATGGIGQGGYGGGSASIAPSIQASGGASGGVSGGAYGGGLSIIPPSAGGSLPTATAYPSYTNTQGISGTAQLPADVRPNVTVPSLGASPSLTSLNSTPTNWADSYYSALSPSGSSSMAMNDPGYSSGSSTMAMNSPAPYGGPYNEIDAQANQPAPTTQTTYKTVSVLNPAYTSWVNSPSAAINGVEGVPSPSLDANGNVSLPSSYLGASSAAPIVAPPKYITQKVPVTVKVPAAPVASNPLSDWYGGTPLGHITNFLTNQPQQAAAPGFVHGGLLGALISQFMNGSGADKSSAPSGAGSPVPSSSSPGVITPPHVTQTMTQTANAVLSPTQAQNYLSSPALQAAYPNPVMAAITGAPNDQQSGGWGQNISHQLSPFST